MAGETAGRDGRGAKRGGRTGRRCPTTSSRTSSPRSSRICAPSAARFRAAATSPTISSRRPCSRPGRRASASRPAPTCAPGPSSSCGTCSSARCAAPASRANGTRLTASKLLAAPASQDRHIELGDMQRALLHLPQPQREALILVGAGGFAYEEAAEICGCAVGTIKSRVARGRVALEGLLTDGKLPSRREHSTTGDQTALQTHHERGGRAEPRPRAGSAARTANETQDALSRGGRADPRTTCSERSSPSMRKAWRKRIADAGVNGGRSHLHEPPRRSVDHGLHRLEFHSFTARLTCVGAAEFQTLRRPNGTDLTLLYE